MTEALLSLVLATSVLLGSPGPVPLALAATGAVFGVRRSIPFLIGILGGLIVVITLSATGIATLFELYPASRFAVQTLGAGYILYVAYKIATAPLMSANDTGAGKAPALKDGFILNLLNPKAYAAFLALFSQAVLPIADPHVAIGVTALVAFLVAIVIDAVWLTIGGVLRPVFESPYLARPTRVVFAVLMLMAVAFMLISAYE